MANETTQEVDGVCAYSKLHIADHCAILHLVSRSDGGSCRQNL